MRRFALLICAVVLSLAGEARGQETRTADPYVVVLGIGQDAGVPQAGSFAHPGWRDKDRSHFATSIGLVDPETGQYWIFEATPDIRQQWYDIHVETRPSQGQLAGVLLTHAHIGHYAGLMFFGHESAGTNQLPVYAMPRMSDYLRSNGPWSQLVKYENISIHELTDNEWRSLNSRIRVRPFLVPHRQEFSEVVGYIIEGPNRKVLFLPDIDSWHELDDQGVSIEALIEEVDIAFLDATFYANGEIPGRDMSSFPHPFITTSMRRFASLPQVEKDKIHFIHMNHTNPVLDVDSDARQSVEASGFRIAFRGQQFDL
ncbi:MAG: pyrroloquinoline quinone biosynthesis protein PqqB [Rhodothermales bacterium]|nr:pyrroloquinoline quinone biosynthesis protein PqqB [Rhodothermales bacterium]